jgi:O-antigen ligase
MTGLIIIFAVSLWLLWFYYRDSKECPSVSSGAWIAVVWIAIYGSRPVTEWFIGPDQAASLAQSRDEGNPVEALISLSLILCGVVVLARRGVRLSEVLRTNIWLAVFYLFWIMSISWSDYPFITFKRLFKDLGNVVMALIVLTEMQPDVAIKAVVSRVAYLCVPVSVLLIRYYPELGRVYAGYDQSAMMSVGVATHKNTLGVLAFVGAVFVLWNLLDKRKDIRGGGEWFTFVSRVVVLLMSWYLLRVANSATSLVCGLLGTALIMLFTIPSVRRSPGWVEVLGYGSLTVLVVLDTAFDLKEILLESLGRDTTLTSRTDFWPILINFQDNPLLGMGFNTFWTGDRLLLLPESLRGNVQAHNGYLETYLNGGLIGVSLLGVLLLSAYVKIRKQLVVGIPEGTIRFVVLLVAVLYNYSEASFNKVGVLWVVTLFALLEYRRMPPPSRKAVRLAVDTRSAQVSRIPVEAPYLCSVLQRD